MTELDRVRRSAYEASFREHGDSFAAIHESEEGKMPRYAKPCGIGDLRGRRILDVGCGLGGLYPVLKDRFGNLDYCGVDVVDGFIETARTKYPEQRFLCRDIIMEPMEDDFDYVLMCSLFNKYVEPLGSGSGFMERLIEAAWGSTRIGLGFNFLSTFADSVSSGPVYHDPRDVLSFCLAHLSPKVALSHHYFRCDTSVFVYR